MGGLPCEFIQHAWGLMYRLRWGTAESDLATDQYVKKQLYIDPKIKKLKFCFNAYKHNI